MEQVLRKINDVELVVDPYTGQDIYFRKEFSEKLPGNGLSDILYTLYNEKKKYVPLSLMIELTNGCNFNCPFCYIHTCKRKTVFRSGAEIIKQLELLIQKGLLSISITGGECMIHPDFIPIYTFLKKNGVLVTVLSNLSRMTDEIFETFQQLPPYKVDVSIYAMDDAGMAAVTGSPDGTAQTVLENIIRLKNAGIHVTAKTAVNTLTAPYIKEIREWCDSHKIEYFNSYEVFENYEHDSMERYSMGAQAIAKDQKQAHENKYGNQTYIKGSKKMFECKGGQYGLFISYDNILRPCMPFYDVPEANISIGTIGLEKALTELQKVIERYKGNALPGCGGCNVANLCQICVIDYLRHKESDLLSYMKISCEKNWRDYMPTK